MKDFIVNSRARPWCLCLVLINSVTSQRFIFNKDAKYCNESFRRIAERTSNWSNFNRVGQNDQLDRLDDSKSVIASNLSQNQNKFETGDFYYSLYSQMGRGKGSEDTGCEFELQYRQCSFYILYGKRLKKLPIFNGKILNRTN